MSASISLKTFKTAVSAAGDDAALRLKSSDGSLTTAKQGFFGRVATFFRGHDKAEATSLAGQFLQGMREKYGEKVANQAFQMARPSTTQYLDGTVSIKTDKPLTAREIRDSLSFARALTQAETRQVAAGAALLFAPENEHAFGKVLRDRNIDPANLTGAHKAFYKEALRDEVLSFAGENRRPPKPDETRELAGKALRYAASLTPAKIHEQTLVAKESQAAGVALARAFGGSGNVAKALNAFFEKADARLEATSLGGASGSAGGDDLGKARLLAMDSAINAMSPAMAKRLYEQAMVPEGAGRLAQFGLNAKLNDRAVSDDMHAMSAATQLASFNQEFLVKLGERGGAKDARGQVEAVSNAGFDVTKEELRTGTMKPETMAAAGIKGSKAALGLAQAAIEQRAPVLKEAERVANERDLAGAQAEARAEGRSRSGSDASEDSVIEIT